MTQIASVLAIALVFIDFCTQSKGRAMYDLELKMQGGGLMREVIASFI